MEGETNAKRPRHSQEDRRKNTNHRRRNKRQERRRKREDITNRKPTNNDEVNISKEETCLVDVQTVSSGETSLFGMKHFEKLKEENHRLHKHAVYFHYQWKKSEEKAKTQMKLTELDRNHLNIDGKVGEGTFGHCYRATYGSIKVAVKEIKSASLDEEIMKEAKILQSLRHPNLPLLLGVCFETSPFLIVTTYHSVKSELISESTTIHNALCHHNIVSSNLHPHWLVILHDLSMAISYVHEQGFIHNDIKTNNVVVEKHNDNFSAVLIDFGKATTANSGRTYPEFDEEEKEKYERKYPYLAPELKSGGGKQTVYTDVYSFGYLMKVVNHSLNDRELSALYHKCKNISPIDRPRLPEIEKALKKFII